ncbi:MAG TPA: hypothetical protein DCZ63_15630 [Geobacter sp.]|nr:hypothetical protein [Geobacter sp.]
MNIVEIVNLFRTLSKDTATPYLCSDAQAVIWAAEAEREACIRASLIHDSRTIALSTPDAATLDETTGSLVSATYSYRVSAINASGETLASTAATLAVGASAGVVVTWEAVTGATGYKVYGRTAGQEKLMYTADEATLTWTDAGTVTPSGTLPTANTTTNVVKVPITTGRQYYPIHASIHDIESAYLTDGTTTTPLSATTRQALNIAYPYWRTEEYTTNSFIHDDTGIRLIDTVAQDWTLWMDVYRSQINPMSTLATTVSPEIHVNHHEHLVDWMLKRYYELRDPDAFDPRKAGDHEKNFANHFGYRKKANTMKQARANRAHKTRSWW